MVAKIQEHEPLSGPAPPRDAAAGPPMERHEGLWRRETLAALGGMAEEVAHQIRNPLGSIELMASLLLREQRDDRSRRRVERILSSVREIESRIGNLLSASWIYGFCLQPVRLHEILEEIFQSHEAFLDGDETFLEIRYGAGEPVIRGDRQMLRHLVVQMVLKLLSASSACGRLVIETASPVALPGGSDAFPWAAVRFRLFSSLREDLPDVVIRDIFREENREEGIFLAVVRNIIEAHRGIIRVTGAAAAGLSLILYLPCLPEAAGSGTGAGALG